jgi:hypothetical protein
MGDQAPSVPEATLLAFPKAEPNAAATSLQRAFEAARTEGKAAAVAYLLTFLEYADDRRISLDAPGAIARLRLIFSCPAAAKAWDLALQLGFETTLDADAVIRLLGIATGEKT